MPPHRALIAYTTNAGSTTEVARAIAEELNTAGISAEIRRIEENPSLEGYEAVIVGAPMILGWHRAALRFVRTHQAALSRLPVAYFFTAMRLTDTGAAAVDGVPLALDPTLAKPPSKPGRLSFKENYATPTHYLEPALRAAPAVRPLTAAFFGGKLALYNLKWWQALFVLLVIQARPGGYHNLPFIRDWARDLGQRFEGRQG
jgi:menaquinone-dependent protoporphyrinogen IX oxidase